MILSILANYTFGLLISVAKGNRIKQRFILLGMVIFNLSFLFYYKYLDFLIQNINRIFNFDLPLKYIELPIGISFFTFQAMSYVLDVYREKGIVQRNPLYVGLYISFFPQLIAGPIVRYETVANEIEHRNENLEDFCLGVRRFLVGLSKKTILANTLATLADKAFEIKDFNNLSASFAILGIVAYTLQIYYDFSGYSDMAIGLGRMFGFHFLENFDYPYYSKSITQFWRKWHMSLGSWFRDYVYIPLGGSRVNSKSRLILNLLTVWFLTGLWHGASWNFVIWGLMYWLVLVLEKLSGYPDNFKNKSSKYIYSLFTIIYVMGGWILFRAEGTKHALNYILSILTKNQNSFYDFSTLLYLREYGIILFLSILFAFPVIPYLHQRIEKSYQKNVIIISNIIESVLLLIFFFIAISYLAKGVHNPFIYFNF